MLEYQQVETAQVWPSACFCGSQKGPFADTFIERNGERMYVCKLCARRVAAVFGFMKGDQLDRLMHASDELTAALAFQAKQAEQVEELVRESAAKDVQLAGLRAELEQAEGEVEQYRHIARTVRESADQLAVGGES